MIVAAMVAGALAANGCADANGQFGRREVPVGTIAAIRAVKVYADPAFFATRRQSGSGFYRAKAPVAVRTGKTITLSIARKDRALADLAFSHTRNGQERRTDVARFSACRRGHERGERGWSSWAGAFYLKRPGCVHLVAQEPGSARVHRGTLSFGMGTTCR